MHHKSPRTDTEVCRKPMGIEFVRDELGGIEDYPQSRQGFAYIPVRRGKFVQSQGLHSYGLVCPVQGKAL